MRSFGTNFAPHISHVSGAVPRAILLLLLGTSISFAQDEGDKQSLPETIWAEIKTLAPQRQPVPDAVWERMQGSSWHSDLTGCAQPQDCRCPPRESLVLLTLPYRDFQGQPKLGNLIVAASVADEVAGAFQEIFESGEFRIERMELVDSYGGSDARSMDANNTSAFNCRKSTGSTRLSSHSFGTAIDINPIQNPYVKGSTILPEAGRDFDEQKERMQEHDGVIVPDDVVTAAFEKRGWTWGGDWDSLKDYQHFSKDGR